MKIVYNNIETLANLIAEQVEASILAKASPGRWLKISQACKYAQMSKNTLMECISAGDIRAKKRKKGGWVVDRLSIDEYNGHDIEDALYSDVAQRVGL